MNTACYFSDRNFHMKKLLCAGGVLGIAFLASPAVAQATGSGTFTPNSLSPSGPCTWRSSAGVVSWCSDTTPLPVVSSGGGSSSAAAGSYADGWSVTHGTRSDTAWNLTDASATIVAVEKAAALKMEQIRALLATTLTVNNAQIAGAAISTGVGASAAGTQRVVLATDSTVGIQAGATIATVGNVSSGVTDTGAPVKIGGKAFASAPTAVTAGQRVDQWFNLNGAANVQIRFGSSATVTEDYSSADGRAAVGNSLLATTAYGFAWNGATFDRIRGNTNGNAVIMGLDSTTLGGNPNTTVYASTGNNYKATAGNLASLSVVNSTAAGFVIVANLTAVPASGTAITAAQNRYCMPVAASVGFDKVFQVPLYNETGITVLFSTSCTTYTPVATAPVLITAQFK